MSNARELLTKIRSRLNSYHHADLLEMIDAELAKPETESWDCKMIQADAREKTATVEFDSAEFVAYAFSGKYKLVLIK
jgi:hypothetical protein